ncbi:hypothetical protein HDIA_2373 [Hartmannibacter diazotrophicus]|uniref:Uncharacterized protein n=1 Tax=Hartmannibacter diazotrophicus TaxID=1482074 RepID=A0A2C9D6G3_9HYPH|nr:hypothetical protein HDIA_2373 [Hartmannibacter diazotrophicus]
MCSPQNPRGMHDNDILMKCGYVRLDLFQHMDLGARFINPA